MRISVLVEDTPASMRRYTARVHDNGLLTFDSYDELERPGVRHQWRLKRSWHISVTPDGIRFDGVQMIERPALPENIKKKLLASARSQLEWGKDQ